MKVVIVPVNENYKPSAQEIKAYLDNTYKTAITFWDVSVFDSPLTVDFEDNKTEGLDTELPDVAAFTKEMRSIKRAMKKRSDYDKNAYYIFLVKESEDGQKNGIMPFRRHFGFVFMENSQQLIANSQKLNHTIAHELAHGAFGLEHPWQSKGTTQGSTYNLLDYTTKTPNNLLRKYQWYVIHNPRLSLFGGAEEETSDISENVLEETKRLDKLYSGVYFYDRNYNLVSVIRIPKSFHNKYYRLKYYINVTESVNYKPLDFEYNNYTNNYALTNFSVIGFGGSFGVLGGYLKTGTGIEIVIFLNGSEPLVPLTYTYDFIGVDPKLEVNFGYGAYVFAMDYWKEPVSMLDPEDYEGIFNAVTLEYKAAALSYIWGTTDNKIETVPMTEYNDRLAWLGISLGIGESKSPASLKNYLEKLVNKVIPWVSWASMNYKLSPELSIVEKITKKTKIKELNINPSYSSTYWKKYVKK